MRARRWTPRWNTPDWSRPLPLAETTGAFAIIPHNDLAAAIRFWEQLRFVRVGGDGAYAIMQGWGCELHLTQAGTGPWAVAAEHNPFGVFIRTPQVETLAALADDLVVRPGGVLRHRAWGLYEVGICGPDGMLIRIGWPSRLMPASPA